MKTLTLPKGSPDPLPELAAFLAPFAPLFRRATSRRSLERYVSGVLTDLPRKNCETIAQAVAHTSLEQLQHLLTDAAWDPLALDEQRVRLLVEHSPSKGVLVLDDTGLPKQGKASVGVQHQYSGTLGKQGNCQIVVSAQDVVDDPTTSQPLHWPINARLYLPEVWTEDHARCQRCRVPEGITFASKPDLAVQLLDRAVAWGVPFATVVTDAGYGIPSFLRALDVRGLSYVCAVASDFGVRLLDEMRETAVIQAQTPARKRGQPKKPRPAPRHDAQAVTQAQPEEAWQTVEWREGSQGPLRKQFVALRVHAGTGCARHSETHGRRWTGPEGWLIGERPLPGEEGEPKWFFSSLPAQTPLSRLVELAHLRWPIEQFYEDAKGECGLDHFQGRRWDGLHRHLAIVMLASTFLMLQSLGHEVPAVPASEAAFPPARQISLPACHRQVLVWLFQDLVLWLIETDQVKAFRPRRNYQSSISRLCDALRREEPVRDKPVGTRLWAADARRFRVEPAAWSQCGNAPSGLSRPGSRGLRADPAAVVPPARLASGRRHRHRRQDGAWLAWGGIARGHLVAAFAHQTRIVLAQVATLGKGQELSGVAAVLAALPECILAGRVVTGDALLAQRDLCAQILKKRAPTSSC